MPRRWTVLPAAALVACFTGGLVPPAPVGVSEDVYQQARLFEQVLAHVRDYHVDSLPERELYRRAIDGMLEQLHDPYAALLAGQDYQRHAGADHRRLRRRRTAGGRAERVDHRRDARCRARRASGPASAPATCWSRWTAAPRQDWTHGARGAGAARAGSVRRSRSRCGAKAPRRRIRFRLTRERIHQRAVPEASCSPTASATCQLSMVRENCAAELDAGGRPPDERRA